MSTAYMETTDATERPSRLVAEALVHRQDAELVVQRAKAMGLDDDLARTLASVCGKQQECTTPLVVEV